jgi:tRNA delta(2)-isopentenylpyrophosphate transferase
MKIILIFGPQAVGKMTIGEKVGTAFNLPLLHNHVTLDAIWPYIGWNKDTFRLSDQIRMGIFEHIAEDDLHPGIIFTFVWAFDMQEDWDYISTIKKIFNKESQIFILWNSQLILKNGSEEIRLSTGWKRNLLKEMLSFLMLS